MPSIDQSIFDEGLVTVAEAAAFLRISRSQLYELLNRGEIPSIRILSSRRIPKKGLLEFAVKCGNPV